MKQFSNYNIIEQHLKHIFERIDYDANGHISKNELKRFFEQNKFRNEAYVEDLMFTFDVDLDGVIDYHEFKDIMEQVNEMKQKAPTQEQLHVVFRTFDLDGNQLISFRQFSKMARKIDKSLSKRDLLGIFNEMDDNKNGYINFEQFQRYFSSQSQEAMNQ